VPKRTVDALTCPHCDGPRRLIAQFTDPIVVRKILAHLGLPTEPPPRPAPARARGQLDFARAAALHQAEHTPRPPPAQPSRPARSQIARAPAQARLAKIASTRSTASANLGEPLDGSEPRVEPPSVVVVTCLRRELPLGVPLIP